MGFAVAVGKFVIIFSCLAIWVSPRKHVSARAVKKAENDMTESNDGDLLFFMENAIGNLGKREEKLDTMNDDPEEEMLGRNFIRNPDGQDKVLAAEDLKDLDLLQRDRGSIQPAYADGGQYDEADIEEVKRNEEEENGIETEDDHRNGENLDEREVSTCTTQSRM